MDPIEFSPPYNSISGYSLFNIMSVTLPTCIPPSTLEKISGSFLIPLVWVSTVGFLFANKPDSNPIILLF